MEREIMRYLETWKDSRRRKPLMLTGVRQCGKTYVVKEFGKRCFTNTIYLNFESNERLSSVFLYDFDVERIIREIEILVGQGKAAAGRRLFFLMKFRNVQGQLRH